jgi:glycosyltransferase involved in cell wall biosynthesis
MEPTENQTWNLDEVEIDPAQLPFKVQAFSYDDPGLGQLLAGCRMVLGSVSHRQNHLSALCRSMGVPCAYISEYSLKTRCQIILAETRNPVLRLRRIWWQCNQERRFRRAIRLASGIQCNGTPTFEAYRAINPRPFLFFDTRTREDMLATEQELEKRTGDLMRGGSIRLLFSGRLNVIKGADHLVQVASELRRIGVPFHFTICGGGPLEHQIRNDIDRLGLGNCVKLTGILDFKTKLTPLTKRQADLFVCCHRQGDPSSTYLEVMSCGVPIAGYGNEAFMGIIRHSDVGWTAPMNQPQRVARKIAELNADRTALAKAAYKSLEFARRHTFERTFRTRIEHLKTCSARQDAPKPEDVHASEEVG